MRRHRNALVREPSTVVELAAQYIVKFPPGRQADQSFLQYLRELGASTCEMTGAGTAFGTEALRLPLACYRFRPAPLVRRVALAWHDLTPLERSKTTATAFANERGISAYSLCKFVTSSGKLTGIWSDSMVKALRLLAAASDHQQTPQEATALSSHSSLSPQQAGTSSGMQAAPAFNELPLDARRALAVEYPGREDDEFYIDALYQEFFGSPGEPVEAATLPSQPDPWPLNHPDHGDSGFYRRNRELIDELCRESGRPLGDEEREKLAASLVVAARSNGMERIDKIAFGDAADAPSVWAVQRSSCARERAQDCRVSIAAARDSTMQQIGMSWRQAMEQFKQFEAGRQEQHLRPLQQDHAVAEPALKHFKAS